VSDLPRTLLDDWLSHFKLIFSLSIDGLVA